MSYSVGDFPVFDGFTVFDCTLLYVFNVHKYLLMMLCICVKSNFYPIFVAFL